MDSLERINELKSQGFFCSQILLLLGMELSGKDNPDLVRAMQALAGGLGFTGHNCGSLTGGACLLGLYAGKGAADEIVDSPLDLMIMDLVKWFQQEVGAKYGGIDCDDIIKQDPANIPVLCPPIIEAVFNKVKELLVEYGYDLSGVADEG